MCGKHPTHTVIGFVGPFFLLAAAGGAPTQAPRNLVANPDFEAGPAEVQPGFGGKGSLADGSWVFYLIQAPSEGTLDLVEKHSGKRSYRIDNGPSGRGFLHSKAFPVQPNTRYRLSGWVRTEGAPENAVFLRVFWFTKEGPGAPCAEKTLDDTPAAPGTSDWRLLSAEVTSPKDAAFAYVRLETNDGARGVEKPPYPLTHKTEKPFRVWFDGIEFSQVGGAP